MNINEIGRDPDALEAFYVVTRQVEDGPRGDVTSLDIQRIVRRRRRAGWLAAAAAACVAGAAVIPSWTTTPAYAVESRAGGVVHVTINRLEGAPALQRSLEQHGIPANVKFLPEDTQCAEGRFAPAPSVADSATTFSVGSNVEVNIDRRDIKRGDTVVIASSTMRPDGVWAEVGIAHGPIAPCRVIPAE